MHSLTRVTWAFALFSFAATAGAANLLTNPNFDTDLSGWTATNASQGAATFDNSTGSPSPGSALLTGIACCTVQVSQCVAVVAGQSYDFGASLKEGPTAPGQSGDGTGVDLIWFSNGTCTGGALGVVPFQPAITTSWASYSSTAVAPVSSLAVQYRIRQYNNAALSNLTSNADNAFFGPSAPTPVVLQSFGVN